MAIKRKLGFGHLGNGLVVWDSLHEKNGDYEKVAHINHDRKIKYFAPLTEEEKSKIEEMARLNKPYFYK